MSVETKETEKDATKYEKGKLVMELLQFLAVCCTAITLFFSLYPQYKPNNTNLLEKANAGDVQSQLQLADIYYETGDFSEAIYWYKLLLLSGGKNDVKALAYNNLGVLYSRGYGLSVDAVSEKERLNIAFSLFEKAYDMFGANDAADNKVIAANNRYILLVTFGEDMFEQYDDKLKAAYDILGQYKNVAELTIAPEREIVSKETITSPHLLTVGWLDENTYLVLSGANANKYDNGSIGFQYVYLRIVYEAGESDVPFPMVKYIKLEDMNYRPS